MYEVAGDLCQRREVKASEGKCSVDDGISE